MNRRTTLKGILALSVAGVSSFSAYKWISLNKEVNIAELQSYKTLIDELAETIIPSTNTPGAKEAGVSGYIVNILTNCTGKREQNKFLNGLQDLEAYTNDSFDKSFVQCNANERTNILKHFEEKGTYSFQILNKINNKFLGQSFFSKLKSLTVEGYCLSELGATKGLVYDYIPQTFEACIPLKNNQKSWATK
ncbi:gluconate 2-dehydrogenase subunit 3 family protein [Pedobacter jamesrossensis]|uniref:Gluconate 2-dehydrogenase subunit 3 family protein n=1 Tax=Pedobacter jamesrossensis TaxID=1908238 RepID=A0ABV8NHB0_9SPHI